MADTVLATPVAADAEAPRRLSLRAQLALTHLAFAHNFLWTALLLITLPAQVVTIAGERNKNTALAGVLVAGALIAAASQVVGGALSDRATFRLGRRRPFILGGTAIALLGLALMSLAHSLVALAAGFLVLQFGFNFGQAAYAALIPDRVAWEQRGSTSGLLSLVAILGTITATVVAGKIVREGDYGTFGHIYLIAIVLMALLTATTAMVLREEPLRRAEPFALRPFLRSLWVNPRAYPDFAWVFVTRFLVMMGYFTVLDFLFYYVRDELGRRNAAPTVSLITEAVIVGAALTVFVAGRASDRVGRKPVVYVSSGLIAVVSLAFIVTHTVGLAIAVAAVWGLGWGAYASVDWALAIDVLPRPERAGEATGFARYMGIWSLALTVPQVISPAIGPLIDVANRRSPHSGYTLMFGVVFFYFALGALLIRNVRTAR